MSPAESIEAVSCENCTTVVEVCAFCDRSDCARVICYRCLRVVLGQSMEHPHDHGG